MKVCNTRENSRLQVCYRLFPVQLFPQMTVDFRQMKSTSMFGTKRKYAKAVERCRCSIKQTLHPKLFLLISTNIELIPSFAFIASPLKATAWWEASLLSIQQNTYRDNSLGWLTQRLYEIIYIFDRFVAWFLPERPSRKRLIWNPRLFWRDSSSRWDGWQYFLHG